ncbi:RING/U-box superfamily protein [Trifolium repens]|nr:RING/U-box superfamily protein [Trifolium repens]
MDSDDDDYSYISDEDENHFSVLTESDIKRLQNEDIDHISSILSLSKPTSSLLLSHFNWNITQVMESWFDNPQKVQKITGLSSNQHQLQELGFPISSQIRTCDICFDTFSKDDIKSSWCGHLFCIDCWNQYIDTNIDDRNCFDLRCPQPSCNAVVDEDMIRQLASESRKIKYDRFLIRSYVETNKNRKLKWCPAPDCGYAIDFDLPDSSSRLNYDVTCLCYHSFCWNCGEEAHAPANCETVAKWMGNISSYIVISTNSWIITNTKPCPNCKIPIQKNQGCRHMNCKLCKFNFCWSCLCDFRTCSRERCKTLNVEQVQKLQQEVYGEEMQINNAKNLERYTYYYDSWAENEISRKKALSKLIEISSNVYIKSLSISKEKHEGYFHFMKDVWNQIVEGRRILKWANVYGYNLPENEKAKTEFFEHIKGMSQVALDKLHHSAETELGKVLNDGSEEEFRDLRLNLINLTSVTKKYFMNLVKDLENGLDVVSVKNYTGGKRKRVSSEIGDNSNQNRNIRRQSGIQV